MSKQTATKNETADGGKKTIKTQTGTGTSGKMTGGIYAGNVCGENPGNFRIPMQNHNAAVMICTTLVNTQTHTRRQLLSGYTISSQPAQLMT